MKDILNPNFEKRKSLFDNLELLKNALHILKTQEIGIPRANTKMIIHEVRK